MRNNISYLGTDPNTVLVERLYQIVRDYAEINNETPRVDIRPHGSQVFVPEWAGTVGLAFSSPPYYDEEDYVLGDQSYKPGMSYTEWLNSYVVETIKNIHKYLTDDGVFCINVKNVRQYKLEDDVPLVAEQNGFRLIHTEPLNNNKRPHPTIGTVDNSEKIFCFVKRRDNYAYQN